MTTDKRLTIIRKSEKCAEHWGKRSDSNLIINLNTNGIETEKEALEYALEIAAFAKRLKREHPDF